MFYLQFKLSAKELDGRTLWASVWDNARLSHNTFMGEIRLDLAGVDFTVPTQKTFNLQEKVWCLGFYFHVVFFFQGVASLCVHSTPVLLVFQLCSTCVLL